MRRILAPIAVLALVACSRNDASPGAGDSAARPASGVGTASAATPAAAGDTPPNDPDVRRADLARIAGDSTAKVWLIVVSDFQCPYCKMWHDSTDAMVRRDYVQTGKIRMAFVNFPLNIHPNAPAAHETAMCAAAQGKFWQVHDRIFDTQPDWSRRNTGDASLFFVQLAEKVEGVNPEALKSCLASGKMKPMIRADYERGMSAGVNSTPSFVLGRQVVGGAVPPAEMRRMLDAALAGSQ